MQSEVVESAETRVRGLYPPGADPSISVPPRVTGSVALTWPRVRPDFAQGQAQKRPVDPGNACAA